MKQIILTFGLILCGSVLFGQSPRIRLNQITKDSLTGSVVLSGSDSNMVYSRDFFLNLTDSVLILFGDTLSTTATAFTGVATDLTLTGNGTVGNELKVDTAIIATVSALADSLAGIISSVTTDLTLTGDGSIATPLKVDTSVIATIRALSDSLATLSFATNQDISDSLATLSFASLQDITDTLDLNLRDFITGLRLTDTLNTNSRGFLTQNQTITLTDDATGSGTTSISVSVVDDSHNHTISTLTGIQDSLNSKAALVHTHTISDVAFLQDSLDAKANDSDLNNYLLTSNYIVDSTRINLTGDTAYYYQNGVLIGTGAIAGGGGGGSGTVTSITAGTYLSGGTITTSGTIALDTASAGLKTYISENIGTVDLASEVTGTLPVANGGTGATTLTSGAFLKGNGSSAVSGSSNLSETADTVFVSKFLNVDTATFYIQANSNRVGIGTSSPLDILHVKADALSRARIFIESTGTNVESRSFITLAHDGPTNKGDFFTFSFRPENQQMLQTIYDSSANAFYQFLQYEYGTNNNLILNTHLLVNPTGGLAQEALEVEGNARFRSIGSGASAGALHYTSNGTLTTNTSDLRLKTNLQFLENTLSKLLTINTYTFNWINETNRTDIGMIAQEVEEIFPDLVFINPVDGYKGIHYDKFSSILTKAIQEQQAIIETQQQEIETLKTQIQNILTEINNLKNN